MDINAAVAFIEGGSVVKGVGIQTERQVIKQLDDVFIQRALILLERKHMVAALPDTGLGYTGIAKLPQGYARLLGKTFEGSVDLSGGEWQKLALGRAFMRASQLLILDEPTAALDALAEYDVYKRFAELTAGKITIFISHRFSTVRMAQQIVVLQDGQVTEMGSHTELMALNK